MPPLRQVQLPMRALVSSFVSLPPSHCSPPLALQATARSTLYLLRIPSTSPRYYDIFDFFKCQTLPLATKTLQLWTLRVNAVSMNRPCTGACAVAVAGSDLDTAITAASRFAKTTTVNTNPAQLVRHGKGPMYGVVGLASKATALISIHARLAKSLGVWKTVWDG